MTQDLSPTSLAQYIKLDNCDRFLRFRLNPSDEKRLLKKWGLTIQPLTPLLKESGTEFEQDVIDNLKKSGAPVFDLSNHDEQETLRRIQTAAVPTYLLQPSLLAPLGSYTCGGRADILRLSRNRSGTYDILIADIKASRKERTEHRLQVAVYAHLVTTMLMNAGIPVGKISGAVLTQQDDGSLPVISEKTPTFDLDTYYSILHRLVTAPDSTVNRIIAESFEDIFYHLSYKCDGCLYNAICMYDATENLDLALTPQITAVEKRVLLESNVRSLPELANLMDLPPQGSYDDLTPAPDKIGAVESLKNRWPVGATLPLLVQRARAVQRSFDKTTSSRSYLLGTGYGTLPRDDQHLDLIKIFFDAQHDYLKDRVYLVSAYIQGPRGDGTVVKIANNPPTHEDEGSLLRNWVNEILGLLPVLSSSTQAPIHLYCYNRYDQQVLLAALKRHLTGVVSIPAFFDLMTQSPALSQPMISFLADEVHERLNLGLVCSPLHNTAAYLGFDWQDERYKFYEIFRARMFDNRRFVIRQTDGSIARIDREGSEKDPRRFRIEVASRFNSQIPLEYAYAAWDALPEPGEDDSRVLEPFRLVRVPHLVAFAGHRVRALAHIENSFKQKAFVQKEPLDLHSISTAQADPDLALSLQEFLYMEHHASLQARLLTYALPIDRRVTTGLAMLLRCESFTDSLARFTPEFRSLGLDPGIALNACKLKEGDWVVLNPAANLSPSQMKHGRLAIIEKITRDSVTLVVRDLFGRGKFRYSHKNEITPIPGQYFTIDEMPDDMNGDKVLDALQHVDNNVFYDWLLERPLPNPSLAPSPSFFSGFSDQVDALLKPKGLKLTARQREVISANLAEPLVLVQGPPGTGKSYTLAWAILAQIAARAVQNLPCRIAVSCKTHNAVNVVLKAVAEAKKQIAAFPLPQFGGRALAAMQILKLVNDVNDPVPSGVIPFDAYNNRQQIPSLLNHPAIVFGGTSGGLYSLMKYNPVGGRGVDWNSKPFDVLVIDEASQMSLPEGVLSAIALKPSGKMMVVGDHRQMPPIIVHDWEEEQKRTVAESRPYISLFESLLERGFPRTALDRSFRLHKEIAEFLHQNIYVHDGIQFFSHREELLHPLPAISTYVDAVLSQQYPIVVIEHTESSSQQYNPVELALTRPLIQACIQHLSLDGRTGIGVVVPHRAQKALLKSEFPSLAEVNSIDTVERFQGDERDVIIVSATASDPDYVRSEADFLLNMNRLNVAISRPRKKLIVIASRSVIDLLTSDLDVFENAVIWKRLYHHYTPDILHESNLNGYRVSVRGRMAA